MTNQELDEAVARKLGWEKNKTLPDITGIGGPNNARWYKDGIISSTDAPPPYSTDIKAAWEILAALDGSYSVGTCLGGFYCQLQTGDHKQNSKAVAETAELAICKAFLAMEEVKSG